LMHGFQVFAMGLRLAIAFRIKQLVTVFPRFFGLIHGLIGMAQQGIGIFIVFRVEGDAYAGRDGDLNATALTDSPIAAISRSRIRVHSSAE